MEIYRQTLNTVTFEAPDASTSVSATIQLNDGTEVSRSVSGTNDKVKSITLPYIQNEGTLTVNWRFSYETFTDTGELATQEVVQKDTYEVVTPILSDGEIKEIHPNATAAEIRKVEQAVRHIINAHTGQTFGKFVGKKRVRGKGGSALELPSKLISLTDVDGKYGTTHFDVIGDGWWLAYFPWGVPPVKADYYGLHMHTGGVIHNPNHVKLGQFAKRTFEINGVWGYEEVPQRVKEAAKLLVNDYACADQNYRDRYLTSMTAADWRIQFHSGAFVKTGNVRADQLLSDFVLQRGWAVI